jgi:hypothetical protein
MAKYSRKGAGNLLRVYEIDTAHTTPAGTLEIEFNQTFASAFTRQDSGAWEIALDQDMVNKEFWAFLKDFAIAGGTATDDEFYEDGTIAEKVASVSSGGSVRNIMVVWHGESHPKVPSGNERRCFIAVATVATSSGAFTTNNNDRTKPTVTITTVPAKEDVLFAAAKFAPALVIGADQTLPKGSYGEMVFLDIP